MYYSMEARGFSALLVALVALATASSVLQPARAVCTNLPVEIDSRNTSGTSGCVLNNDCTAAGGVVFSPRMTNSGNNHDIGPPTASIGSLAAKSYCISNSSVCPSVGPIPISNGVPACFCRSRTLPSSVSLVTRYSDYLVNVSGQLYCEENLCNDESSVYTDVYFQELGKTYSLAPTGRFERYLPAGATTPRCGCLSNWMDTKLVTYKGDSYCLFRNPESDPDFRPAASPVGNCEPGDHIQGSVNQWAPLDEANFIRCFCNTSLPDGYLFENSPGRKSKAANRIFNYTNGPPTSNYTNKDFCMRSCSSGDGLYPIFNTKYLRSEKRINPESVAISPSGTELSMGVWPAAPPDCLCPAGLGYVLGYYNASGSNTPDVFCVAPCTHNQPIEAVRPYQTSTASSRDSGFYGTTLYKLPVCFCNETAGFRNVSGVCMDPTIRTPTPSPSPTASPPRPEIVQLIFSNTTVNISNSGGVSTRPVQESDGSVATWISLAGRELQVPAETGSTDFVIIKGSNLPANKNVNIFIVDPSNSNQRVPALEPSIPDSQTLRFKIPPLPKGTSRTRALLQFIAGSTYHLRIESGSATREFDPIVFERAVRWISAPASQPAGVVPNWPLLSSAFVAAPGTVGAILSVLAVAVAAMAARA